MYPGGCEAAVFFCTMLPFLFTCLMEHEWWWGRGHASPAQRLFQAHTKAREAPGGSLAPPAGPPALCDSGAMVWLSGVASQQRCLPTPCARGGSDVSALPHNARPPRACMRAALARLVRTLGMRRGAMRLVRRTTAEREQRRCARP